MIPAKTRGDSRVRHSGERQTAHRHGLNHDGPSTRDTILRRDLEVHYRAGEEGGEVWICDPVGGTVARLDPSEYELLTKVSNVPFDQLSPGALQLIEEAGRHQFLRTHSHSLMSRTVETSKSRLSINPLAIRFPGFQADAFARFLASRSDWVFSCTAVVVWGIIACVSVGILMGRASEFWQSVCSLGAFQARYWILSTGILAATKVAHELAHATVCRRMGVRCKEIGVLLLCGIPTLYCDVSESWRIASSWRRSSVMLAGVYIELIVATLAIWCWVLVASPLGRMLAVNTIVLCGISSVVFNLNPLMRYDGYYVLSDWLNLPNLRARAASYWRDILMGSMPSTEGRARAQAANPKTSHGPWQRLTQARLTQTLYAGYHLASATYRYFVFGGLLLWGYHVGRQGGVEPLARAIVMAVVGLVVLSHAVRWIRMVQGKGLWRGVSSLRRWLIGFVTIVSISCLGLIPFQKRIRVEGMVDFANTTTIYIPETAAIRQCSVMLGDNVFANQALLVLEEPALRLKQIRIQSECDRLLKSRRLLVDHALESPEFLSQLPSIDAAIQSANDRLGELNQAIAKLTIIAPHDGVVLPLSMEQQALVQPPTESSSTNLLRSNLNLVSSEMQMIAKGKPWCRIGTPEARRIVFRIDALQRQDFVEGENVRVVIPALGNSTFESRVEAIALSTKAFSSSQSERLAGASSPSGDSASEFILTCSVDPGIASKLPPGATVTGVARGAKMSLFPWLFQTVLGISL